MEVCSESVRCDTRSRDDVVTESPPPVDTGITESTCSCSEDVAPADSRHKGTTSPAPRQADVMISNTEVKSSSDTVHTQEVPTVVTSEQNMVCDQPSKSAKANTSEPDSSDSVCVNSDNTETGECDSGSGELVAQSTIAVSGPVTVEVDSTQSSGSRPADNRLVSSAEQSSQNENTQCDSCNSEHRDSMDSIVQPEPSRQDSEPVESLAMPGPSSVVEKSCISSSLLSSSNVFNNVPNNHTSAHLLDKPSQVDSSTDKPRSRTNSVSGSQLDPVGISNSTNSLTLVDHSSIRPVIDNEVSNSVNLDSIQSNFASSLPLKSLGLGDSFSVTSNNSVDFTPTTNRHLKFLNDSIYSTDMTVDSTTQYVSGVGASNLLNSGYPAASNYDSDSMDVTSASEPGYVLGPDESRRLSEDSLNSFPDNLSCTSSEGHYPKEKKKVN